MASPFFGSVPVQASFEAALAHMVREDPSLVVEVDDESGQTVLKGIGELHLEVRAGGFHDIRWKKNQNLTHQD